MNTKKNESGQAIILIVLAIVGLIGLTALAVDGGMAYSDRRQSQNAADASALAAALTKVRGGDWHTEGLARAISNNFDNNGTTNTVLVNNPPVTGCDGTNSAYAGNGQYVQVVIRASTQTFFGPVVGITEVNNCVEAIARAKPATTSQMALGDAVVSLAPHGCDRMWVNGHPNITVIGGGVFTNSDDPSCAFRQNGSGSLTAPSVTVVGGASYNSGHVTPAPTTGATAMSYPPDFVMPNPSCSGKNAVQTGSVLGPGLVGNFPPSGVDTLNPGIYCVTGDFHLNGHQNLTGSEVVIVMLNGTVTWNGTSVANLSGPTSGPFAGLLLYQPIGNTNTMTIDGTSDLHLTGAILAPGAEVRLLGTGGVDSFKCQVIGYNVQFGGNGTGTIRYEDNLNYDATVPPQIELTQ